MTAFKISLKTLRILANQYFLYPENLHLDIVVKLREKRYNKDKFIEKRYYIDTILKIFYGKR